MKAAVKTSDPSNDAADALVVPLFTRSRKRRKTASGPGKQQASEDVHVPQAVRALDRGYGGIIAATLETGDFKAERDQTLVLYPSARSGKSSKRGATRIVLVGLGSVATATPETARQAAGQALTRIRSRQPKRVSILLPHDRSLDAAATAAALLEGTVLAAYGFERYRSSGAKPNALQHVTLYGEKLDAAALRAARSAVGTALVIAESQNYARDLSNEPGNELPPAALAAAARKLARETGLKCTVMDEAELRRRKMGGILAVGAGSSRGPRLIVLEHGSPGRGKRRPTFSIVGKGITFDSGGISLKPSASMEEMKHDMGGAAAVLGAMRAVALLDLPLHVTCVVAAAENMPGGKAYRPGDVVRTLSGKTIEVLNTDAEGRIVLADALHYTIERFSPDAVVDLATLTGACQVALGRWASGLFGNDASLVEKVRAAGDASGEIAWPLPLFDEHRKEMRSTIADLKNTGGRTAGASTAAGFLAAFVGETPWVHLDIAGTGWTGTPGAYQPKGGTGVGVRLLVELLRHWR